MSTSSSYDLDLKKRFLCQYADCNKSYSTAGNLKSHLKVHTGHLPYRCNEESCKKSFLTSYALRLHQRGIHTKEKPYVCQQNNCSRAFNTQYRLKSHQRIHNGDLLGCEQCGKQFISKSDLTKHFRIHTGEKPFKCFVDKCHSAFTASHHLKNHLVTHKNKPFRCSQSYCDKKFKNNSTLKTHMRTKHNFSIIKRTCSNNQTETIHIQATPVTQLDRYNSSQTQTGPTDSINLPDALLESQETTSSSCLANNTANVNFDVSKGIIQINTDYQFSTSSLNSKNFYDLLIKLQQKDQFKMQSDLQLTSQFLLSNRDLDSLLEDSSDSQNSSTSHSSCHDAAAYDCQELCCLLKFSALEEF